MRKTVKLPIQPLDVLALLVSFFYMQSVLTVAHHTSMWVHDGSTRTVGPPAVPALIIGLLLCCYAWRKNGKPSTLVIMSLTILATASLFWLSGLKTNFYY